MIPRKATITNGAEIESWERNVWSNFCPAPDAAMTILFHIEDHCFFAKNLCPSLRSLCENFPSSPLLFKVFRGSLSAFSAISSLSAPFLTLRRWKLEVECSMFAFARWILGGLPGLWILGVF